MNRFTYISIFFSLIWLFASCEKEQVESASDATLFVQVEYNVDQLPLLPDTILYINQAGNLFGVRRLEFFISDLQLYKSGQWEKVGGYAYFNAFGNSDQMNLALLAGKYDSVSLNLGLDPSQYESQSLPSDMRYVNMAWPKVMGGGYHFLKLEGHFLDSQNTVGGYALHLGSQSALRNVHLPLSDPIEVGNNTLYLQMDVVAWMGAVHEFDFKQGQTYTMGIDSLMNDLAENGTKCLSVTKIER